MTERDAFGRPIAGPGPTVQPLGNANPAPGPSSGPGRGGQRPRGDGSGLRRFLWWFVVVDLIAIIAIAAVLFAGGGSDDDLVVIPPEPNATQSADGGGSGSGVRADGDQREPAKETPAKPAAAPAGFNATSLLTPANLERALDQAKAVGHGRPLMLRAEAARVDLQLARTDGTLVIMQVPAGGAPAVVTKVAGAARGRPTMSWSAIDADAPKRLATATKSTPSTGPRSTNYVVFLAQTRQWVLYRTSGKGFIGSAAGRGGTPIPGT